MIHKPIQIRDLGLSLPNKTCFDDFNAQIIYGSRIAIIGRNGSGKTTLLKILTGAMEPRSGIIQHGNDVIFGFVPQIIENFEHLSVGQRLNQAVTAALSRNPNVLLLDEPTNHLDLHNRKSLLRMLQNYQGTLIVVSHDTEVLRSCIDTLWHIDNGQIHVFFGNYDDYMAEIHKRRNSITQEFLRLEQQKHDMHDRLMKEQRRAAKSKAAGKKSIEQRKWPTIVSAAKACRAEETSGRKKSAIDHKKQDLNEQLLNLRLPEIIKPKFSISAENIRDRTIIAINDGRVGHFGKEPLLKEINFSMHSKDRVAICGDNASGKSTLIKAILSYANVLKSGEWTVPQWADIGYLDQHYGTLAPEKIVCETIEELVQAWKHAEVRSHLNDFLFRKNEEVNLKINQLSCGEKARLSLAQIAAKTPKLLILDEITNNLDLETKEHVVQVLKGYPGAMIVISHEVDFLKHIDVCDWYKIENGKLIK